MKQWELRGVTVDRRGLLITSSPVPVPRRDDDRSDTGDAVGAEAPRPVRSGGRNQESQR